MRAGQLRETIEIQALTDSQGSTGNPLRTWTKVCDARASVEPLKGAEYLAAKEYESAVTVRVRMRARKDVTIDSGMRVKWKNRYLEIVEEPIEPYARGREWQLMCKEFTG